MRARRGFTLLELLIAIGIIAILAAILLPNMVHAKSEARLTACVSNLRSIATAISAFGTDNGSRLPATLDSVVPTYLEMIPTCPAAERDTYSGSYVTARNPDAFTVVCVGAHHAEVGLAPNFPQYMMGNGLVLSVTITPGAGSGNGPGNGNGNGNGAGNGNGNGAGNGQGNGNGNGAGNGQGNGNGNGAGNGQGNGNGNGP